MNKKMKYSGIEWIGEIPKDWKVSKLKYIKDKKNYSIVDGPFGSAISTQDYMDEGIPLVRITNLSGDYVSFDNMVYISETLANSLKRSSFTIGDIVFAKTGATVGKCAINSSIEFGILASSCIKISIGYQFNTKYYFYIFNTKEFVQAIINACNGTTRDTINLAPFNNLYCTVPPLETQQRIVDYLDEKCKEIDNVVENTKVTIEEYKKYKYAVIADAVTKGLLTNVVTKKSGVDWIGNVPENWKIIKLKYLFSIKKEIANKLGYDILSVTQNGLKIKDISNNEGQISSDYSKYQIVEPNDFVMNHMDLLTGWVDCSAFHGVTSPDYRVFKLDDESKSLREYFKYIFQLCYKHRIFYGLGQGVSNLGRWRLQTDKFINFEVPLPSFEEQKEIVEFLDKKCTEIDNLIFKKQQIVTELENYKKSLIYECVTGKMNVEVAGNIQMATIIYPKFPATISTDKRRFAQAILASKVIDEVNTSKFGRVKLEKILYTLETHVGFDFDTAYKRQVAGPLDGSIYQCENMISKRNKWFNIKGKTNVEYSPAKDMAKYKNYYNKYFADYNAEIERIIKTFKPLSTEQSEIFATLYASWNDFVIGGTAFTDDDIVKDVLNNWHVSKKRFSEDIWLQAIEQMRELDLVPKGYGKKTVMS